MRFRIFILIIAFFASCDTVKESGCAQFKNGEFAFRQRTANGMKVYLINRQDSVQTEMDPETMKYTKGEVKWVGDCKYELYYRMSNSAVPGSARTDTMSTEILSWTRDYYLFRSFVGGKLLLSDTMWIKKDEAENSK